ncbi:DUF1381 domain-containing protein [Staphylococcus equorum]|uniref:DUF1381 domain-containing protein n=1 Tax=Staphylococcus equorum TaxID=246432 RepID=UPI0024087289|nr:DUF1381 domain-containing protein [Staphylococcus equorum]MDG0843146.1 DUF1381 domain-containing protein [Staphylococcus equorum]
MTKYLIKTITHDTGEVFESVRKIKDNETFEVIEVENNTQKDVLDKVKERMTINEYTIEIDMNEREDEK